MNTIPLGAFWVDTRACIASLFFWRGPSAVIWRVVTIILHAIKRVLRRWASAHVGEECREVIAPAVADRNPSSAPILVTWMRDVETAPPHVAPRVVLGRCSGALLVTVFKRALKGALVFPAATTHRATTAQIHSVHDSALPARAPTQPHRILAAIVFAADHEQPPKALPGKVDYASHV